MTKRDLIKKTNRLIANKQTVANEDRSELLVALKRFQDSARNTYQADAKALYLIILRVEKTIVDAPEYIPPKKIFTILFSVMLVVSSILAFIIGGSVAVGKVNGEFYAAQDAHALRTNTVYKPAPIPNHTIVQRANPNNGEAYLRPIVVNKLYHRRDVIVIQGHYVLLDEIDMTKTLLNPDYGNKNAIFTRLSHEKYTEIMHSAIKEKKEYRPLSCANGACMRFTSNLYNPVYINTPAASYMIQDR